MQIRQDLTFTAGSGLTIRDYMFCMVFVVVHCDAEFKLWFSIESIMSGISIIICNSLSGLMRFPKLSPVAYLVLELLKSVHFAIISTKFNN